MVHFSECSTVAANCNTETQIEMRDRTVEHFPGASWSTTPQRNTPTSATRSASTSGKNCQTQARFCLTRVSHGVQKPQFSLMILTRIIFCFSPQVTRNHYPCRGSPFLHRHPSLPSPFATPQTRSEQTYFSGASREISFSNIICFYRPRVATDGLEVTLSKPKPSENRNPKGPLLTNNLKK